MGNRELIIGYEDNDVQRQLITVYRAFYKRCWEKAELLVFGQQRGRERGCMNMNTLMKFEIPQSHQ